MRNAPIGWVALALLCACGAPSPETLAATSEAIAYAEETDLAIDLAVATGQSVSRDADVAHQQAIDNLRKRTDAAERLVIRAQQAADRLPYLALLGYVGHDSPMANEYLTSVATRHPTPQPPSADTQHNHDDRTDYERMLGESIAAAHALVRQGDWKGLWHVYSTAPNGVAAVAAGSAARVGMLDDTARQTLNGRGITGSFQPLSWDVLRLPDATLGPSPVGQPVEGPQ